MGAKTGQRRSWGHLRQLPTKSRRFQASYIGPDRRRHKADRTFPTKVLAEGWLSSERKLIDLDAWTPPAMRKSQKEAASKTLNEYASRWIKERDVKETTREHYETLWRYHIEPNLGDIPLRYLTIDRIQTWHSVTLKDKPTARARAYGLLHAICAGAVKEGLLASNPCQIERAMKVRAKRAPVILHPKEIRKLANEMPERYRALVLIAAACGLRWGQLIELRRKDFELDSALLHVHRAVTHRGTCRVGGTKSGEKRDVIIPAVIMPDIKEHLAQYVSADIEGLLFPAARSACGHLNDRSFREYFNKAAKAVGRQGLTIHALRHFQGTIYSQVGGTVKETQVRLGHATVDAAMIYQHAVDERQRELASRVSDLLT